MDNWYLKCGPIGFKFKDDVKSWQMNDNTGIQSIELIVSSLNGALLGSTTECQLFQVYHLDNIIEKQRINYGLYGLVRRFSSWFILCGRLRVRIPGRDAIVGARRFSSNQAIGKVFSAEYTIYAEYQIYLELVPEDEAANYRPYAYPSYEVAN